MAPDTPLRRSTRGQPLPSQAPLRSSDVAHSPSGAPLFERATDISEVLEEERETPEFELSHWTTRFYSAFTCKSAAVGKRAARVYGRANKGKDRERTINNDITETYQVGDTVLVQTASKVPSIATIVAVLAVAEEGRPDKHGCRIMVHWFVRQNELPRIRAQRDQQQVRICASSSSCHANAWAYILLSIPSSLLRTKYSTRSHQTLSYYHTSSAQCASSLPTAPSRLGPSEDRASHTQTKFRTPRSTARSRSFLGGVFSMHSTGIVSTERL